MTQKRVLRFFDLTEYEAEEKWLSEMHASGWKAVKAAVPGSYTFEECSRASVVYKLAFSDRQASEQEDFHAMCRDYGWSYLFSMNGWDYYCKEADQAEENNELFTDDSSKLEMIRRVMLRRFLPFTLIFAAVVLPNVIMKLLGGHALDIAAFKWYVLAFFYVCAALHMGIGFYRLYCRYGGKTA